jgi:hypothetical protein
MQVVQKNVEQLEITARKLVVIVRSTALQANIIEKCAVTLVKYANIPRAILIV